MTLLCTSIRAGLAARLTTLSCSEKRWKLLSPRLQLLPRNSNQRASSLRNPSKRSAHLALPATTPLQMRRKLAQSCRTSAATRAALSRKALPALPQWTPTCPVSETATRSACRSARNSSLRVSCRLGLSIRNADSAVLTGAGLPSTHAKLATAAKSIFKTTYTATEEDP